MNASRARELQDSRFQWTLTQNFMDWLNSLLRSNEDSPNEG